MPARLDMIQIAALPERAELSKAQAQFNKWIRAIDKQRQMLRDWQTQAQAYHARHAAEYLPLMQTFDALRTELARDFDRAHSKKSLSPRERAKLSDLITKLARSLLTSRDDPAMRELFDRHSPVDFATETANELNAMKAMAENALDIEFSDEDEFDSVEGMMARARDLQREREQTATAEKQAPDADEPKKSAKTLAKEQRLAADAERLKQSLREIYRKLASALHPDREPDAAARERKTGLMQQVNQAYEKNDLLRLLELQLEVEQVDRAGLNAISEERLKHYNKILREQHAELKEEIEATEDSFRIQFDIELDVPLAPKNLPRVLQQQVAELRRTIANLRHDMRSFQDQRYLKQWLKTYQPMPIEDPYDIRFDE